MDFLETTMLLLFRNDEIMLAMKKSGFGTGKFNGVGGKIDNDETIEEAMIRETKEEVGIIPTEYEKIGIISFDEFYKGEKIKLRFHLFTTSKWKGSLIETDEMKPYWFNINNIPYDNMFPDDKYWLPLVIEGKKFDAYFNYDEDWNILNYNIDIKS